MEENNDQKAYEGADRKGLQGDGGKFFGKLQVFDYCPSLNGEQIISSTAATAWRCSSAQIHLRLLEVADPQFEDENTATFFGAYNGPYVYARLKIEAYDDSGLIQKVLVTPA
jgi:hypothetical protein